MHSWLRVLPSPHASPTVVHRTRSNLVRGGAPRIHIHSCFFRSEGTPDSPSSCHAGSHGSCPDTAPGASGTEGACAPVGDTGSTSKGLWGEHLERPSSLRTHIAPPTAGPVLLALVLLDPPPRPCGRLTPLADDPPPASAVHPAWSSLARRLLKGTGLPPGARPPAVGALPRPPLANPSRLPLPWPTRHPLPTRAPGSRAPGLRGRH